MGTGGATHVHAHRHTHGPGATSQLSTCQALSHPPCLCAASLGADPQALPVASAGELPSQRARVANKE